MAWAAIEDAAFISCTGAGPADRSGRRAGSHGERGGHGEGLRVVAEGHRNPSNGAQRQEHQVARFREGDHTTHADFSKPRPRGFLRLGPVAQDVLVNAKEFGFLADPAETTVPGLRPARRCR